MEIRVKIIKKDFNHELVNCLWNSPQTHAINSHSIYFHLEDIILHKLIENFMIWTPYPRGSTPPTPAQFFTLPLFFNLFFGGIPPAQIQIFCPHPRPSDRRPHPFFVKSPRYPSPLTQASPVLPHNYDNSDISMWKVVSFLLTAIFTAIHVRNYEAFTHSSELINYIQWANHRPLFTKQTDVLPHKILWSLEATRFGYRLFQSLWNLISDF